MISPLEYEKLLEAWRDWRRLCYARYGRQAVQAFFDVRIGRVETL